MLYDILAKKMQKEINTYVDTFFDILVEKYNLDKKELKQIFDNIEKSNLASDKNYSSMSLPQLKSLCKEKKIPISKKKKEQLIQALKEWDEKNPPVVVQEEPVVQEVPVVEEPVQEEPVQEVPVVEEPVQEEPVVEEPVQEEPVVEEPVQEEPVVEEHKNSPVVENEKKVKKKKNQIDLEKEKEQLDSIVEKKTEAKKDLYSLSRDELKKLCLEKGIDTKKKKKDEMIELLQKTDNEEENYEDYLVDDSIL